MFNLNKFIADNVIMRQKSMFINDIRNNYDLLSANIKNKTALVIGGAGSIGSSFVKSILMFQPKSLVVVDINENGLAELARDLRSTDGMFIPEDFMLYPMDFSSNAFKKMFIKRKGFDIVANFSAHKHVRSEKDIYSIESLIFNNIINAKKLLELLKKFPPQTYFCVSTDKAANPVNVMGASKRIMEDLIFSYSNFFPVKTARFANVAFSNGSLPAGFLFRINKMQPLCAPNDVVRYFVSPEESGQICLLACILGKNREIFFPKLEKEQMMSFDNIAKKLLQTNGYNVVECNSEYDAIKLSRNLINGSLDYPVYFSKSNTSGEKPFEEFFTANEISNFSRFFALGVIEGKDMPDDEKINLLFNKLLSLFKSNNCTKEEVIDALKWYLPNFQHIETGKSLDKKM